MTNRASLRRCLVALALVAFGGNAQAQFTFATSGFDPNVITCSEIQYTFNGAGGCNAVGPVCPPTSACDGGQSNLDGTIDIVHYPAAGAGVQGLCTGDPDCVELEIIQLNLTGNVPGIGNIVVTLDPTQGPSGGTATSTNLDGSFPADSVITVHYCMVTPCDTYYGTHVMTNAAITRWPPFRSESYGGTPSPFYLTTNHSTVAGMLESKAHSTPMLGVAGMIALVIALGTGSAYMIGRLRTVAPSTSAS